jgi:hypothetical protein
MKDVYMWPVGLGNTRIFTNMPKILPWHYMQTLYAKLSKLGLIDPLIIWHHINSWVKRIQGHTFCTFKLTKNSSHETYMKMNHLCKARHPNVDMNVAHCFALSNFKEMALQRLARSSLLDWWQPTHQIPNMNETPNIWWRISLFAKKIFTVIKNRCTKRTLKSPLSSNVYLMLLYLHWQFMEVFPIITPISWCSISYSKQLGF